MKGLILKDFYNLHPQLKIYLLFPFIGAIYAFYTKDVNMLSFFGPFLTMMCVITVFGYDEQSNFDAYGLTLPLTRSDMVVGKYVFKAMFAVGAFLLFGIIALILVYGFPQVFAGVDIRDFLLSSCASLLAINLLLDVLLPLMFKFGTQKSRILLVMIFLFAVVASSVIFNSGFAIDMSPIQAIINDYFAIACCILVVGAEIISIAVSTWIYRKKEF